MFSKTILSLVLGLSFSAAALGQGVKVLGQAGSTVSKLKLTVVADSKSGLEGPGDLAFNPINPQQLFVVNHGSISAVVLELDDASAETPKLKSAELKDAPGSNHFMPYPSGIAFADSGFFATIHDMEKVTQPSTPADFMGPTLWTQKWFDGGHPSHMDMLHNSPRGMGIAWIHGNAFLVVDGYHGSLTLYDFRYDHGPGMHDHSDGITLRYADKQLKTVKGVPAHALFDRESGLAYAVDSGNNRIVSLDLGIEFASKNGFDYVTLKKDSGYRVTRDIQPNYDGGLQRHVDGASLNVLVDGKSAGLTLPSGLAEYEDVLYVSDHTTGQIHAFSKAGELLDSLSLADVLPAAADVKLAGLEFDAQGRLYMVDMKNDRVYRLEAAE